MHWPWEKRKAKVTPDSVRAICPHCRCEPNVTFEQRVLLASGQAIWPFCALCSRIVSAESVVEFASSAKSP